MFHTWYIYESVFGHYYHTLRTESGKDPVWAFTSLDAARVACRSLNEKRMVSRTAQSLPFSYYDGETLQTNGL